MSKAVNIVAAVAVALIALASMGAVGLNDSIQRPEYCINCHPDPYYNSWEDSDYLAAAHAKAAIPCQGCHPKSLGEAMANIVTKAQGHVRLRRLRVSNEACFRCHAHGSYAELIERTEHIKLQPHVPYHYAEMDCRICHKMHKPSEDYCSECHDPSASGPGWIIKEKRKGKLPVPHAPPS